MSNPKLQPMLKPAGVFDRVGYGFSPIPAKADVRLEVPSGKEYDVMLHIYSETSRTIAFRKIDGLSLDWETGIFPGPKPIHYR